MNIGTQWENRIAALERELSESRATAEGYRLAFEEAQRQLSVIPARLSGAPEESRNAGAREESRAAEAKTRDPSRQPREGDKSDRGKK